MSHWTTDELDRIGDAEELRVSSHRKDGSLRPFITIWVVRVGDDLYLRSAYGPDNGWFRRALASGSGAVQAGGIEREVRFVHLDVDDPQHAAIDAAYHAKYDSHGPRIVGTVVGDGVRGTTVRIDAAPDDAA